MSPLELLLQSFDAFGNLDPIMKLLARTGWRWQAAPLPASVKRGKLGMCYPQARALALKFPEKYFYVEGYACTESAVMPIHHAWCSTDSGLVIDPTWESPERAVYIGAAFKPCAFDEPLPDFLVWGCYARQNFSKWCSETQSGISIWLGARQRIRWAKRNPSRSLMPTRYFKWETVSGISGGRSTRRESRTWQLQSFGHRSDIAGNNECVKIRSPKGEASTHIIVDSVLYSFKATACEGCGFCFVISKAFIRGSEGEITF